MYRIKSVLILTVLFTTVACGGYGNKKIMDPMIINQIHEGVSSKADVERLIGSPPKTELGEKFLDRGRRYHNALGEDVWAYNWSINQQQTVLGAELINQRKKTTLRITFDKNDIVKKLERETNNNNTGLINAE